ncbi:hypothetical protein ACIP88_37415 [Streptomyces uncialis]|uniref:hypothetical protein n=1 Tax=Streptomyces uncialis TaxID=1048205 RepID=UPI0037FC8454
MRKDQCRDYHCLGCDGGDRLTEAEALLLLDYDTNGTGDPDLDNLPLPAPTGWCGRAWTSHPNCLD